MKPELDALLRTARRVVGNPATAEEATQEACLKAYTQFDPADEPRQFRPWLFRILMNQCFDLRRRYGREMAFPDEGCGHHNAPDHAIASQPHVMLEGREMGHALDQALLALTPELRAVVALVLIEEMSYADAAESLDVSEDLVRSRLSRARIQLMRLLAGVIDLRSSTDTDPQPLHVVATKREPL